MILQSWTDCNNYKTYKFTYAFKVMLYTFIGLRILREPFFDGLS